MDNKTKHIKHTHYHDVQISFYEDKFTRYVRYFLITLVILLMFALPFVYYYIEYIMYK